MTSTIQWSDEALNAAWLAASRERCRQRMSRLSRSQVRRLLAGEQLFFNANNPLFYDATADAAVNAVTALLNSGTINVYSGGQPALNGALTGTLLVQLTFGATAFANAIASGGIATGSANAITSGTATNTGTAGYFALVKSDASTVVATGTVGTSGADLNFSTLSIVSGAVVTCSAFSITLPQT